MKEPIQIVANTLAAINDGIITPSIEIGIVLSEPGHRYVEGQCIRERQLETVRFVASPAVLRTLAQKMNEYADLAESDLDSAQRQPRAYNPDGE